MDPITAATSEGIDPGLQKRLAEMEAKPPREDTMPIPLNEVDIARQTRLTRLRDEVSGLRSQLADITAKAGKAQQQALSAVKSAAKSADVSAHAQLGDYPWAKLAAATAATFVGTRLLRALPFGGIASVAAPLIIAQLKARSARR